MNDYLGKPIQTAELAEIIGKWLLRGNGEV
jgi:CheY-like chemotaxis protein